MNSNKKINIFWKFIKIRIRLNLANRMARNGSDWANIFK